MEELKKDIAVVVDDMELNRDLLVMMLEQDYTVVPCGDGLEAVKALETYRDRVAVMLLDLIMPGMDGYAVLEHLSSTVGIGRFPILIISGESDVETESKCLSAGVTDFIKKPFTIELVRHRVRNAVSLYSYRNHLEEIVDAQTEVLREQNKRLAEMNDRIVEVLANIVEARNLESGSHVKRVKGYSRILAEYVRDHYPEYGLDDAKVAEIFHASAMHDIGKIRVSDVVLLKPGRLTPEEFELIKLHCVYGYEILEGCRTLWDGDYLDLCMQICRHHHEKWDGRGYPDGLKGDDIPIAAQIVSVADCFDALTTERVYKKAFTVDKAYEMILGGECGQFNPKLMKAFSECREKFERLKAETEPEA